MALRIASLRIDPVSRAGDRQGEGAIERPRQLGEGGQARVAQLGPALLEDYHRGTTLQLEACAHLRAQRLDALVVHVVEEVEVVDEAGGLPDAQAQQGVDAARRG